MLTTEATLVKRKEIAAEIRNDAQHLENPANPLPQMLRLMESLEYDTDPATMQRVDEMAKSYVQGLKALPADKLTAKKDEVRQVNSDFRFLARFKVLPASFGPAEDIAAIVREQRWDRK